MFRHLFYTVESLVNLLLALETEGNRYYSYGKYA